MILMPETLTAENGAKAALIGEFHETFTHECSECGGDGLGYASPHTQGETPCDLCNGTGELVERIPVDWTTIKEIYKRAVALLGRSPDEWRPMSEAPRDRTPILVKTVPDLEEKGEHWLPWANRYVVVRHEGILESGFDMGWGIAAPVGIGGLSDGWFVGWKPLDAVNGLYTADQLAEAVAAERERCVSACCEIEAGYIGAGMGDCATASHRCAEAIRSAAK